MPWFIIKQLKWKYKHQTIYLDLFNFEGNGGKLFLEIIIIFLLTMVTFGIYTCWGRVRLMKFELGGLTLAEKES